MQTFHYHQIDAHVYSTVLCLGWVSKLASLVAILKQFYCTPYFKNSHKVDYLSSFKKNLDKNWDLETARSLWANFQSNLCSRWTEVLIGHRAADFRSLQASVQQIAGQSESGGALIGKLLMHNKCWGWKEDSTVHCITPKGVIHILF